MPFHRQGPRQSGERREEETTRAHEVLNLNLGPHHREQILTVYFPSCCSLLLPIWHLCLGALCKRSNATLLNNNTLTLNPLT